MVPPLKARDECPALGCLIDPPSALIILVSTEGPYARGSSITSSRKRTVLRSRPPPKSRPISSSSTSEFAFLSRSDSGSETRHNGKVSYTHSFVIFRTISYKIYACYLLLATIIRSTSSGSGQLPGSVRFPLGGPPSCVAAGYSFTSLPARWVAVGQALTRSRGRASSSASGTSSSLVLHIK